MRLDERDAEQPTANRSAAYALCSGTPRFSFRRSSRFRPFRSVARLWRSNAAP